MKLTLWVTKSLLKLTPRHILVKLQSIKGKENILKPTWQKTQITCKELMIRLIVNNNNNGSYKFPLLAVVN